MTPARAAGTWEAVPALADLESGGVAGFLLAGWRCSHAGSARTFTRLWTAAPAARAPCRAPPAAGPRRPRSAGPAALPALPRHYDVRKAGACLEDKACIWTRSRCCSATAFPRWPSPPPGR